MNLIDREELKERLDNRDDIKLVMVLSEWAYHAKHIPGSLHFATTVEALKALDPDEEIVLYDSNPRCPASRIACRFLQARWRVSSWHEENPLHTSSTNVLY